MTAAHPILVRCDVTGCGWEATMRNDHEWKAWHNVLCPLCGRGLIITDADAAILVTVFEYERISKEMYPDAPRVLIRMDTRTCTAERIDP